MFRDKAAGLIRVNSAFIPMIGRLCMSSRAIARWCGVVAVSYLWATFPPLRCLKASFCCGRR
jgi:hypothetical protein